MGCCPGCAELRVPPNWADTIPSWWLGGFSCRWMASGSSSVWELCCFGNATGNASFGPCPDSPHPVCHGHREQPGGIYSWGGQSWEIHVLCDFTLLALLEWEKSPDWLRAKSALDAPVADFLCISKPRAA